ncbi:hypothetical protein IEI94_09805 [Halomonas sp. ML-15]|uniref:hypothetical protein n=1 Tax=Halomonas sp. ML-15 TaxID=2773305 RepID=UPI001745F647|nr:hypothetical protein [Halomonas sp. ML-15]MBD3896144.1 hypothetical protein [Halomonas sp. ML-15]
MSMTAGGISARDLLHDLIPKLKATESFVNDTLVVMIDQAPPGEERLRRERQRQEFQLNLTMIRMNLKHLLKRHAHLLDEVSEADDLSPGQMLKLDEHERVALESARALYEQTQALQTR